MTTHGPHRVLAALALVIPLLSGCAAGSTAVVGSSQHSQALTVATTSAASSLDFTSVGGAAIPAALMGNVYETLVTIDDSGEIRPGLASSWEVDASGTEYTFHLREGVRFSNGARFDATAAAFSINRVKKDWTNGISAQMDVVEKATAIDPHTLQVKLRRRSNGWLWSMGTTVGAMMSPTGVGELASQPVGTGPFTVERFSPGEFIALHRRGDYWSTPAAHDVTIQYFPDTLSAVNALNSGGVDVVWAMQNPELLDSLGEGIQTQVGSTNGEVLLSLNNNAEPFDDPRVRQAIAYGVDRRAANDILWDGLATDTGAAPVPPTDPWFQGKDYYPHDPAKAKELVRAAGAEGAEITLTTPTLPYAQTVAELLYSQLTEIGLRVKLESAEFPAVWLGQVMGAKDYQASLVSHVEPRDIPTLFGDPEYYLGYDSARTRELLELADTTKSQREYMEKAVDQIMADAGAVTLMNMPNIVLSRPGVTGVQPDMVTDSIDLRRLEEK